MAFGKLAERYADEIYNSVIREVKMRVNTLEAFLCAKALLEHAKVELANDFWNFLPLGAEMTPDLNDTVNAVLLNFDQDPESVKEIAVRLLRAYGCKKAVKVPSLSCKNDPCGLRKAQESSSE